ncbi:MAG: alpha/beta fold hydrolase [Brevundimonas sp.]
MKRLLTLAGGLAALLLAWPAASQPAPVEGDFTTPAFSLTSGRSLPELRMHYRTLGQPRRDADGRVENAVLLLHGTGGTGGQFLSPQFAGELFGAGQPLDIARYYIIMPDNLGHGGSSKPSDGQRARFPEYGYADMVEAQRRLLVDGLGVDRVRLMLGTSMGCMHIFVWAEAHPDFADALMPMACQPTAIVGRNRLWRTMLKDAIRSGGCWSTGWVWTGSG